MSRPGRSLPGSVPRRLADRDQRRRRRRIASLPQELARRIGRVRDRRAMRCLRGDRIGLVPADPLRMRRPEPLGGRHEPIVELPLPPVDLIDGPGGRGRFLERLDLGRARAGRLGQRIACAGELAGAKLIEPIDLGFDVRRHTPLFRAERSDRIDFRGAPCRQPRRSERHPERRQAHRQIDQSVSRRHATITRAMAGRARIASAEASDDADRGQTARRRG